jgi:hypothetical protein
MAKGMRKFAIAAITVRSMRPCRGIHARDRISAPRSSAPPNSRGASGGGPARQQLEDETSSTGRRHVSRSARRHSRSAFHSDDDCGTVGAPLRSALAVKSKAKISRRLMASARGGLSGCALAQLSTRRVSAGGDLNPTIGSFPVAGRPPFFPDLVLARRIVLVLEKD